MKTMIFSLVLLLGMNLLAASNSAAVGRSTSDYTTLITVICTGLVSIIAAVGALIRTILKAKEEYRKDAKIKDEKLDVIHVLANNKFSEALREISDLRKQISSLTGTPEDAALSEKADEASSREQKSQEEAKLESRISGVKSPFEVSETGDQ